MKAYPFVYAGSGSSPDYIQPISLSSPVLLRLITSIDNSQLLTRTICLSSLSYEAEIVKAFYLNHNLQGENYG